VHAASDHVRLALWPTLQALPTVQAACMLTLDYCRSTGRRLTYRIQADHWGGFQVFLGDKELLRGRDPLCAHGRHSKPNKRKAAGALHQARLAIESLNAMTEV
jgi:hypothetical protein